MRVIFDTRNRGEHRASLWVGELLDRDSGDPTEKFRAWVAEKEIPTKVGRRDSITVVGNNEMFVEGDKDLQPKMVLELGLGGEKIITNLSVPTA